MAKRVTMAASSLGGRGVAGVVANLFLLQHAAPCIYCSRTTERNVPTALPAVLTAPTTSPLALFVAS